MTTPAPLVVTIPAIEPIKVAARAVQQELGLTIGQIMLGNENWEIPDGTGLYVSLLYGTETVIGSCNYNGVDAGGNFQEIQDVIMLHGVDIDIMSFDDSARLRKEEVVMALQSVYTQGLMETYQMRLATTPGSFMLVSDLEPAKQLNRFRLGITINALHRKTITAQYFDTITPVALVENP